MHSRPLRRPLIVYPLALLLLAGCSKEPEISSYDVPRDKSAKSDDDTRMIAAIFIRDNQAWFLKTMAPKEQVDKVADELHTFAKSINLPEDQPAAIEWQVPEGWETGPERTMREATLQLPDGEVEVAISKLRFPGNQDTYLKDNINRWRGQLGLKPAGEMDQAAGVLEIDVDGQKAWLFDAVGSSAGGGGMMPPMMRGNAPFAGTAATPPAAKPEPAEPTKPTEEKPAEEATTPAANKSRMIAAIFIRGDSAWFLKTMAAEQEVDQAADDLRTFAESISLPDGKPEAIEWKTPEGWQEGPERMMREATLQLPDSELEVAISKLVVRGDLDKYIKDNINRWRGQLGLDDADTMDQAAGVEVIEVDGQKAWLFDAVGTAPGGAAMPPMMRRAPFAQPAAESTPPNSEDE
ncbi:hypothetical protein [Aeoliella sp.]|uniref:hypothetical protein n=1 Tax=Aeoliella sp. TaxID=2795800 RepID=UPI003CCBEF23